ncbi:MAG: ABC transporter ATP-binding protein, partial [Pseudomonadota bacterium]
TLSGGELARVHLARALAGKTPLLLADEPVAALDLKHQLEVMRLLSGKARDGGSVIAALHDLSLAAQYCTRIVALSDGGLVADGAPREVITQDLLRSVFGLMAEDAQQVLPASGPA